MPARQRSWGSDTAASLEHLTGPSRGRVTWLSEPELYVAVGPDRILKVADDPAAVADGALAAKISCCEGTCTVEAGKEHQLWINGRLTGAAELHHGDVVEFGETGPISRFRVFAGKTPMRWRLEDMVSDSIAYLRTSRKPIGQRVSWAAGNFGRRLVHETTVFFRLTVIAALIGLGIFSWTQYRTAQELRASIEQGTIRIEGIASSLARAREEALRPSDLAALREELSQRVTSNIERLEALEFHSGAVGRAIEAAAPAIAFLQGAYGLRHIDSDQMLRHVLSPEGITVILPNGQPLLSLTGNGPVAEVQFTGTGFLLGEGGVLVTNRHVALPWESGDPSRLADQGLEPVMLKFITYLPGRVEPLATEIAAVSDDADIAILTLVDAPADLPGLTLAESGPRAGDEVIVMGYPTGLRAMLAQAGVAFVKELQEAKDTGFWSVAERLAQAGKILPLASRGIVGQVASEAVVYDAETTHGGSGGPVLNADGAVIAVNAAILPEFGGSNLGVPLDRLRAVLATIQPGQ